MLVILFYRNLGLAFYSTKQSLDLGFIVAIGDSDLKSSCADRLEDSTGICCGGILNVIIDCHINLGRELFETD